MKKHNKYFPDLVGQNAVKKKLSFYIEAFNKTSQSPFLLMAGAKGLGKTEFAKSYAKNLYNQDGEKRTFLELNCSTIKNNEQFFEQIFLPLIADNEITILFDECHALPQDLTMAFLSIFNTESNSRKSFTWNEMTFDFNFKQQTFIFATTETDKIFPPLKDRLTIVDFEPYNKEELAKIIKLCATDIEFTEECLEIVSTTIRGNARSAVKRAKEISLYCGSKENNFFSLDSFRDLSDSVGILPYGLTNTEKQVLQILKRCGSATLTGLSAKLGLSKTALQRDHELYLLNKNLIEIDGKRKITSKGIKLCDILV
jgi:Holliday junction resolvasome RuvABC ATP-dependent DNA helicase subunit|tara:strand:+ start:929 stop:1867 length:939 start_codon:yes stop_codon:yes gene_type:complete